MSVLSLIAALLVLLGFAQLAALVAILTRHAIPRSPRLFHYLLIGPFLAASASCFLLAWVLLHGTEQVLGVDLLLLALIYFLSEAIVWWMLVAYSVYHYFRTTMATSRARTVRQDARDLRQDNRSTAQDARDQRQTLRGREQDERGRRQDERNESGG